MEIVNGTGSRKIVGAHIGERITILMLSGKSEDIILSEVLRHGLEGFQVQLKGQPLAFYPFASILKVTKFEEPR